MLPSSGEEWSVLRRQKASFARGLHHRAPRRLCPADPLIAHEQGVVALRVCQLAGAEAHFSQALAMAGGGLSAGAAPCPGPTALPAASLALN